MVYLHTPKDRDVAASHLMRSLDLFALNTVKDGVYNYKQFGKISKYKNIFTNVSYSFYL